MRSKFSKIFVFRWKSFHVKSFNVDDVNSSGVDKH
jgi:hypothetical protein